MFTRLIIDSASKARNGRFFSLIWRAKKKKQMATSKMKEQSGRRKLPLAQDGFLFYNVINDDMTPARINWDRRIVTQGRCIYLFWFEFFSRRQAPPAVVENCHETLKKKIKDLSVNGTCLFSNDRNLAMS